MRKLNLQDERVTLQRRRINSEAFVILLFALFVSIPVQAFLFDAPFEQYAFECICLFVISIYVVSRNIMLGQDIFGEEKHPKLISILTSIGAGIGAAVINGVFSYSVYQEDIGSFIASLATTFIIVVIDAFIGMSFIGSLNKKKQTKIQKQLEENEQHD